MKILQINVVYGTGSTGKIVANLHHGLLEEGVDSFVLYGRGKAQKDTKVKKVAPELVCKLQSLGAKITGYSYAGCFLGTKMLINQINEIKPDIVHLQCINGYFVNIYKILEFLKKKKINTVLTLHAEFMYTANCGHAYECEGWKGGCGLCDKKNPERPKSWFFDRGKQQWKKMERAFCEFDNLQIVAVSDWLKERALMSPFFTGKDMSVIYNGTNTSVFKYKSDINIRKKLGLQDKKVWLYLTPDFSFPLKGGQYIIELAEKVERPDVRIVMVGKNIPDNVPPNIIKVPYMDSQSQLAELYSAADVTIITSKRETFSMVCAESLCCGTPVVGFEAGGPESIAIKEYSHFVAYGDVKSLLDSAQKLADNREFEKEVIARIAQEKYSVHTMVSQYLEKYRQLVK